eukprot:3915877-Pleurochrysis_carterae.AAC.1
MRDYSEATFSSAGILSFTAICAQQADASWALIHDLLGVFCSPETNVLCMPCAQFVQLQEHMAAMAAQVLNHKHMGQRYVEVFVSSEEEAAMGTSAPMQHMQHMPAAVAGPTQIWPTGAMQAIVLRLARTSPLPPLPLRRQAPEAGGMLLRMGSRGAVVA